MKKIWRQFLCGGYLFIICSNIYAQILPTNFALDQNYPNPFDTTGTHIVYKLPINCSVNLWIYDDDGQFSVDTLVSSNQNAGLHEVHFSITDSTGSVIISEGIYICKILATSSDTILFRDSIYIEFRRGNPLLGVWNKFSGPTQALQYNFLTTDSLCYLIQSPDSLYTFCGEYTAYRETPLPELNLFLDGVRINRCIFSILNNAMTIQCSGNGDSLPHSFSDPSVFHKIVIGINDDLQLPLEYFLFQNYPNPFNPSTRIQYQVSSNSYVTLKVYDVLGNEVAKLVDEYKPAGTYDIEFQSSAGSRQLVSGVYYYQLRANDFVITKKMLLLK